MLQNHSVASLVRPIGLDTAKYSNYLVRAENHSHKLCPPPWREAWGIGFARHDVNEHHQTGSPRKNGDACKFVGRNSRTNHGNQQEEKARLA